ncbi:hypothetical protein C1645_813010 [Glomus cerebriforme]|uniref:Uncharacterized protein n=1 Tax=Glomus cerebriforme TaxID=658196 RepID=A0A397TJ79_9GLOM|nr:hypothetical protein C1645_813010 [Glomus cerebriforme]
MSITLLCFIKGNTLANAFPIHIDGNSLVNKPELLATRKIEDYWSEKPPKRNIHVIIKLLHKFLSLEKALSCILPLVTYSPKCITLKITTKVNVGEEDVHNAMNINICMILNDLMGPKYDFTRYPTYTPGIPDFNYHLVELLILFKAKYDKAKDEITKLRVKLRNRIKELEKTRIDTTARYDIENVRHDAKNAKLKDSSSKKLANIPDPIVTNDAVPANSKSSEEKMMDTFLNEANKKRLAMRLGRESGRRMNYMNSENHNAIRDREHYSKSTFLSTSSNSNDLKHSMPLVGALYNEDKFRVEDKLPRQVKLPCQNANHLMQQIHYDGTELAKSFKNRSELHQQLKNSEEESKNNTGTRMVHPACSRNIQALSLQLGQLLRVNSLEGNTRAEKKLCHFVLPNDRPKSWKNEGNTSVCQVSASNEIDEVHEYYNNLPIIVETIMNPNRSYIANSLGFKLHDKDQENYISYIKEELIGYIEDVLEFGTLLFLGDYFKRVKRVTMGINAKGVPWIVDANGGNIVDVSGRRSVGVIGLEIAGPSIDGITDLDGIFLITFDDFLDMLQGGTDYSISEFNHLAIEIEKTLEDILTIEEELKHTNIIKTANKIF